MSGARVTLLDLGTFRVAADGRLIGIQGFLVVLADGARVLVDAGFPAAYDADPAGAGRRDGLDAFGELVGFSERNLVDRQLALCGVAVQDLDAIVLTHSDIDHVGGLALAARGGAPVVVGAAERALARPRYFGSAELAWPEAAYEPVDGDCERWPGVELLSTPGHAPGHLSVLVRRGAGRTPVLLAGDAISRQAELDERFNAGAWDEPRALASMDRLVALAAREGATLVLGHDPVQWLELPKAPLELP